MAYTRHSYSGNAPATTLNGALNNSTTTITVVSGTGYPAGPNPFVIVVDGGTANEEKILCTSTSGNTITASQRGYDGTSAASHASGATVNHCWDAVSADEANQAVVATLGAVTTAGDLLIATGAHALGRLGIGANGTVLASNGTTAAWGAALLSLTAADATITIGGTASAPTVKANGFDGVVVTGTPTTGQIPTATGASTATWQSPGAAAVNEADGAVATSQSTSSTTYTDLGTVGPAATVTTGVSGKALVLLTAEIGSGGNGIYSYMGVAVSGASTIAAADTAALYRLNGTVAVSQLVTAAVVITGLTAGSNTFTAKYRTSGGAASTFLNRSIVVIAL